MAQSDRHSVAYDTLLNCTEIEATLMDYYRQWFRQTAETPFGHEKLFDMVVSTALRKKLMRTFRANVLPTWAFPCPLNTFSPFPPKSILQRSMQKPFARSSGRKPPQLPLQGSQLLGCHYKTAILDSELTRLHLDLPNLSIRHGFAPERWTHSVTPLIEKEEGLSFLTRLRVIRLFSLANGKSATLNWPTN